MFYLLRQIAKRTDNPSALSGIFRWPFRVVIDKDVDVVLKPEHWPSIAWPTMPRSGIGWIAGPPPRLSNDDDAPIVLKNSLVE